MEFKVLDTRRNGAGLDVEVECVKNKSRGIAVLKLYGPSTKKQNVVLVTKSKESDAKFVVITAEEIVRPLNQRFVEGDGSHNSGDESAVEKSVSVQ